MDKKIMQLKTAGLPEPIVKVVKEKGTELPFSGEYDDFDTAGSYLCRQCGLALFRATTKFHSGCGWPSFDTAIAGAVQQVADADGRRQEIVCVRCGAHLGHVFTGERFTAANTRHCVNSLSLDFVPDQTVVDTQEAIFAAGCFWGVESLFKTLPGVLKTEVGYSGGHKAYPTYQEVCAGSTGHYEAVRVVYDPTQLNYEQLAKFFFEIHDARQPDGQGPDRGSQYLSVGFYYDATQQHILTQLINRLEAKGQHIATKVLPAAPFWRAEDYHQNYYAKTGKAPYCHRYEKKF